MPVSVTMPRLGESVSEGTVTRWLKQEGDHVEADEPLLEVSTDKVDTEIPAPSSGVLTSIKVGEDETVDVGVELAVISESAMPPAESPAAPRHPPLKPRRDPRPPRRRPRKPSRRPSTRHPSPAAQQRRAAPGTAPAPARPAAPVAESQPVRLSDETAIPTTAPGLTSPRWYGGSRRNTTSTCRPSRHRRRRADPQAGRPRCRAQRAGRRGFRCGQHRDRPDADHRAAGRRPGAHDGTTGAHQGEPARRGRRADPGSRAYREAVPAPLRSSRPAWSRACRPAPS